MSFPSSLFNAPLPPPPHFRGESHVLGRAGEAQEGEGAVEEES